LRELVRAGERRGARPDERDPLAGRGALLPVARVALVGPLRREALEEPDLDRRPVLVVVDARPDAEDLDGADEGARVAEDVGVEDRARRAPVISCIDFA